MAEQVKAGKLRSLAVAAQARIESLPNVPTIAESGYRNVAIEVWNGLFAPAKTPTTTITELAGLFTTALQVPEVRAKLIAQGFAPVGKCGADFVNLVRGQYDDFGRVIREANIKAE